MATNADSIRNVAIFAGAAPRSVASEDVARARARSRAQLALFWKTTLLVVASLAAIGALVVAGTGVIWVSVQEKQPGGTQLRLAVPAILVPVGLRLVPRDVWREQAAPAQPWMPVVKAAADELKKCPDGTFVEVRSRSEYVNIAKRGGEMVVDVDDEDNVVHVAFPIYLLGSVAHQLEVAGSRD
jgi:hypothetical protein